MKYIKPEITVVKADGMLLSSSPLIEVDKADPTKPLGSEDNGNYTMAKHNPFDIEDFDDTGWKTNDYGAW